MEELIAKTTAVLWLATCVGLAILLLVVGISLNLFVLGRRVFSSNLNFQRVNLAR